MIRVLNIKNSLVEGDNVRKILNVFPQLENAFTQRKTYDEYYFEEVDLEFTLEDIQLLNDNYFVVEISSEMIYLYV